MTISKEGERAVGAIISAELPKRLQIETTEEFYAAAVTALSGPRRRTAIIMRALNMVYWLSIICALAWLFSQIIDRGYPSLNRIATVITPTVRAGDELRVQYQIKRVRICAVDVSWTVRDSSREVHRFGPKHIDTPGPLGPDDFISGWPTPASASPGPAMLHVTLAYQCRGNYLQAFYPLIEDLPDIPFDILPR